MSLCISRYDFDGTLRLQLHIEGGGHMKQVCLHVVTLKLGIIIYQADSSIDVVVVYILIIALSFYHRITNLNPLILNPNPNPIRSRLNSNHALSTGLASFSPSFN